MKKALHGLIPALIAFSSAAGAQPAPGAPPAAGTTPAPAAPPTQPEPTLPNVDDPMLVPPPAPTRVLKSWREGLSIIKSSSTSLRSALARIRQGEARARQADAAWMPKVDAGAEASYELITGRRTETFLVENQADPGHVVPLTQTFEVPGRRGSIAGQVRATIPLFAPQAWYDSSTAEQAIDVVRLDENEVKRQVVASVADAIVTVVTSERLAEVSRVSLRSALSTVDLNKRRAALGASSTLDVLRAEQEVQLARAQVVAADEGLVRAREALGLSLGSTEEYGVTPDIRLDSLANDANTSCRSEKSIATRPDVKAAAAQVALAERGLGSVNRSYLPRLDGSSSFTFAPRELPVNNRHYAWDIRATLTWNLYDGGLRYGQKDEVAANVSLAREALTDVQRRAQLEVSQSIRAVKVAEANLGVSTRAREIAAETARLAKVAYMNGSGTSFDLVDTARRQREAELDLTIKEFQVLRARIAALLSLASCSL
jgi:outer membrane protein TolC